MEDSKGVAVKGLTGMRKLEKDDIGNVGDHSFVRINPINTSLVRLVCVENEFAPKPVPNNSSLTHSVGLQTLISLRNAPQLEEQREGEFELRRWQVGLLRTG